VSVAYAREWSNFGSNLINVKAVYARKNLGILSLRRRRGNPVKLMNIEFIELDPHVAYTFQGDEV